MRSLCPRAGVPTLRLEFLCFLIGREAGALGEAPASWLAALPWRQHLALHVMRSVVLVALEA